MEATTRADHGAQAFIRTIGRHAADGALRAAYESLQHAGTPRPGVYAIPGGEVPNIIKCHSLDPAGLRLAFMLSGAVHWGPLSLPWAKREMINTVTSRANSCFY